MILPFARALFVALLGIGAGLPFTGQSYAHANLVSANSTPNAVLEVAPAARAMGRTLPTSRAPSL